MRAYLFYSSSAHFLLLAALFLFARSSFAPKKEQAYYIDFIGPSKIVTMEKAAAAEGADAVPQKEAQKAAAKPAAPDEDAIPVDVALRPDEIVELVVGRLMKETPDA